MGQVAASGAHGINPGRAQDPATWWLKEGPQGGRGPLVTRSQTWAVAPSHPRVYSPCSARVFAENAAVSTSSRA